MITFESIENGALNERFKMGLMEIGQDIMKYFADAIAGMPKAISSRITIIG